MKKHRRFPLLASAIALALMSTQSASAWWTSPPAAPAPHRAAAATPALTEAQKIQSLIGSIEHLKGAVFIRNGTEYDAVTAAAHLRRKLDYAGKKVKTADQFISRLATGSSMSGKPYRIRFADGHSVESAVFLREQLRKLGPPAKVAKG